MNLTCHMSRCAIHKEENGHRKKEDGQHMLHDIQSDKKPR